MPVGARRRGGGGGLRTRAMQPAAPVPAAGGLVEPEPEPEPQPAPAPAPEDRALYRVVFDDEGPLGLVLASTDGERGRVKLAGITPGSQAEERCGGDLAPAVAGGLLLASINEEDVSHIPYLDALEKIKTAARPLCVAFELEPAPPPPIAAPSGRSSRDGESVGSGLWRVVSKALSRSALRDAPAVQPPPTVADLVAVDDISGLKWTSSNPDSLGQLPRVELSSAADEGEGAPHAGAWSPASATEADPETQWKQRERAAHKEGYLSQREDGFLARWQRRWFVVDYGVLKVYKDYEYYRKEKQHRAGDDAAGSAPLRRRTSSSRQIVVSGEDVVDSERDVDSVDTRDHGEFDFVIRLPMDKTLTLRASSQVHACLFASCNGLPCPLTYADGCA